MAQDKEISLKRGVLPFPQRWIPAAAKQGRRPRYWTPANQHYPRTVRDVIAYAIKGELAAICLLPSGADYIGMLR